MTILLTSWPPLVSRELRDLYRLLQQPVFSGTRLPDGADVNACLL